MPPSEIFVRRISLDGETVLRPLGFYVSLIKSDRTAVVRLIRAHGGKVVTHQGENGSNIICLIDKNASGRENCRIAYSSEFVTSSVEQGKLLNLDDFRIAVPKRPGRKPRRSGRPSTTEKKGTELERTRARSAEQQPAKPALGANAPPAKSHSSPRSRAGLSPMTLRKRKAEASAKYQTTGRVLRVKRRLELPMIGDDSTVDDNLSDLAMPMPKTIGAKRASVGDQCHDKTGVTKQLYTHPKPVRSELQVSSSPRKTMANLENHTDRVNIGPEPSQAHANGNHIEEAIVRSKKDNDKSREQTDNDKNSPEDPRIQRDQNGVSGTSQAHASSKKLRNDDAGNKEAPVWDPKEDEILMDIYEDSVRLYKEKQKDLALLFQPGFWERIDEFGDLLPQGRSANECRVRFLSIRKPVTRKKERKKITVIKRTSDSEEEDSVTPVKKDKTAEKLPYTSGKSEKRDRRSTVPKAPPPSSEQHIKPSIQKISKEGNVKTKIFKIVSKLASLGKCSEKRAFRALRHEGGDWRRALRFIKSKNQ